MSEKKDIRILAYESSCDETSTAVIKNGREIESLIVATQIKSHQRFGGVVPEVAFKQINKPTKIMTISHMMISI